MEKCSAPGCPLDEQRPLAKLLPHQNVNKMRKNWSQVTKKVPKVRLEDFTSNPKKTNTTKLLLLRHDSKKNRKTMMTMMTMTMAPCRNSTVGSCKSSKPWRWDALPKKNEDRVDSLKDSPGTLESQLIYFS